MKTIYLILAPFLLLAEVDLGDINVTSMEEQEDMDFLVQKESFLPNAPMQQQMTTQQALGMAGTNGDPLKAIKTLAGVVSTNNDEGSEIYIHGSKPRETAYSINHLPLGYVFHLGGIHSVIAPEATAQIDAYLGGFDTTYGTMGAVVDITPKYPEGSNKARVHVGLYDSDFAYDAKLGEDTSLFLSGRRSYIDLFAAKIMDNLAEDERDKNKKTTFTLFPQYHDANLILSHNVGNNIFSFEAITAEDKMKLNSNMNETKDPVANGKINSKYGFTTLGARWNYMGDNFESMTLLSQMKSKQDSEFFDEDFFINTSTTSQKLYHETVFEVENHKPLIGMELEKIKAPVKIHFPNSTGDEDYEPLLSDQEVLDYDKTINASQYALFAQDIWDITDQDHFRYGLRAWKTDFQNFGSGIDPRIAYVHDFSDGLSSSFAMGRYSQLPNVTYALDGFGNPLLEATEFSNHYALNITKKFDKKSSLVVEPYFKTFDNLAIADKANNYEGVGTGEAYGVDVTYRKKVDKFDMIVAYTYVKAKRQLNTDNKREYRFQGDIPHTLQANIAYKFDNNWKISSRMQYNSGAPYTPIVGTEDANRNGKDYKRPIYGEAYSKRMPSTYDLDIQVGRTFKYSDSSLELAFELMNVNTLFKKNVDSYRYNDDYEIDGEYNTMGFLPAFHVTYRF